MSGIIDRFETVRKFAESNDYFITTGEMRELGVPPSTVTRWCRTGLLKRYQRGVYRIGSSSVDFDEAVTLAGKVMAEQQAIGGRSALELWDLPGGSRGRVQLIGPRGVRTRSVHVLSRQVRDLRVRDVTTLNGTRLTTPARSIVDAAVDLDRVTVADAVARGVQRKMFSSDQLVAMAAELGRSGRSGIRTMREVLSSSAVRPELLRPMNSYEKRALRLFRSSGIPRPETQFRIDSGHRTYYVDFAWPQQKLVVECDSVLAHSTASQLANDLRRQNDIVGQGWKILRFSYWDIADDPARVIAELRAALGLL